MKSNYQKRGFKQLIAIATIVFTIFLFSCSGDSEPIAPITYTVIYEANGGMGFMEHSVHTYGVEKRLNANGFINEGFGFAGWATEPTGTVKYADEQNIKNLTDKDGVTITLYAIWGHFYNVAYDANGGSGNMANSNFTYHKPQALSANLFTYTGYTFSGWAKSPEGQVVYKNEQIVGNLTDNTGETVNLYAIWKANTYTVLYYNNGGSGIMESSTFTWNVSQSLSVNTFTRTDHVFIGWAKTSDEPVFFEDKEPVTNLTSTAGGTVILYAKWVKISHSESRVQSTGTNALFDLRDETIQPNLDIAALKQLGYTQLKFDVSFKHRILPGSIGSANLRLLLVRQNNTGEITRNDFGGSSSWTDGIFLHTASIDSTNNANGEFMIQWRSTSLLGVGIEIGERTITITALK